MVFGSASFNSKSLRRKTFVANATSSALDKTVFDVQALIDGGFRAFRDALRRTDLAWRTVWVSTTTSDRTAVHASGVAVGKTFGRILRAWTTTWERTTGKITGRTAAKNAATVWATMVLCVKINSIDR